MSAQITLNDKNALPRKVSVREGRTAATHRVQWAADVTRTVGERTITGTLDDDRLFTRSVTVLPKRLSYFVDAGGQVTSDYAAGLRFAKQRGDTVINTAADQRFGTDLRSGAHWGYFGTTEGASGTSGNTITSTVRWQADKTDLEYTLRGLSTGK